MIFRARRTFIISLLALGFLTQAPPVFCSQKMADISRYEMMQTEIATLSPTELSLVELQRERQDLLRNRGKENPRIFKNKLTILNNKITFLEDEIRRAKPYVVKQRLVPATDKPLARPQKTPVAVEMKAAPPQAAPRMNVSEAPVPVRPVAVGSKPFSDPTHRAGLHTIASTVKPQSASQPAGREATGTLGVRVQALPISEPTSREAVSQRPLAAKRVVPAEPVRAAAPAAQLGPATAQPGKGAKTGADWKKMTREDKEIYILSVMGNLSRRDVYLMKPYNFYIDSIDQAIDKNPLLEQEFIHRILMMTAYDSEPDTRKDLEKVWK